MKILKRILYKFFRISMYNKMRKLYILETCIGLDEEDDDNTNKVK